MKLPSTYYNPLSYIGTLIAIISLFMIVFLAVVGYFFEESNTYLGLFTYIILPGFMIIGLIIIPIGMMIQNRKKKRASPEFLKKAWPVIDLPTPSLITPTFDTLELRVHVVEDPPHPVQRVQERNAATRWCRSWAGTVCRRCLRCSDCSEPHPPRSGTSWAAEAA